MLSHYLPPLPKEEVQLLLMKFKISKFSKMVHIPFSNSICLRALANKTLTFGTGSDARLKRSGSKCSINWSAGMHPSLTTT